MKGARRSSRWRDKVEKLHHPEEARAHEHLLDDVPDLGVLPERRDERSDFQDLRIRRNLRMFEDVAIQLQCT